MKNIHREIIGIAIGIMMSVGQAVAGEIPFRLTFSGSNTITSIDTNGDGLAAAAGNFGGKSSLGMVSIQTVGEFLPPLFPPAACPASNLELSLMLLHGVIRVQGTGDLLFFEYTSGTNCIDPVAAIAEFQGGGIWTGGTGRFENVSGTFETTATGEFLVPQIFSSFVGEVSGTLIFPQ